jgi:hypothetical protein
VAGRVGHGSGDDVIQHLRLRSNPLRCRRPDT